jgi:hypothetical protein
VGIPDRRRPAGMRPEAGGPKTGILEPPPHPDPLRHGPSAAEREKCPAISRILFRLFLLEIFRRSCTRTSIAPDHPRRIWRRSVEPAMGCGVACVSKKFPKKFHSLPQTIVITYFICFWSTG